MGKAAIQLKRRNLETLKRRDVRKFAANAKGLERVFA